MISMVPDRDTFLNETGKWAMFDWKGEKKPTPPLYIFALVRLISN